MAIVNFLPRKVSLSESTSVINVAEWVSGSDDTVVWLTPEDWSFESFISTMNEATEQVQGKVRVRTLRNGVIEE